MMKLIGAVLLTLHATMCLAAPTENHYELEQNLELTGGYSEGDIILDANRNGMTDVNLRWPNGIVYFVIDVNFSLAQRNQILLAMTKIEEVTCITFVEVTLPHSNYVSFNVGSNGCGSTVGWQNRKQDVNLKPAPVNQGCFILGSVIHEILHSLGFRHMHMSWDRDNYVQIVDANILDNAKDNFRKYDQADIDHYGEAYDIGSIMHNPPNSFSKNGLPTIVPLQPLPTGVVMGQRVAMSSSDIRKVNNMYQCPTVAAPVV